MSKHGTIRRYTLEIEKIKRGQYPSFQEIKDYLFNHGFEIGDRTIQRDFEQIRFEFGVEIKSTRDKNGYFIDYEKLYEKFKKWETIEFWNFWNEFTRNIYEINWIEIKIGSKYINWKLIEEITTIFPK